jgi:transcriptional regulator with XRE-family HTH domain
MESRVASGSAKRQRLPKAFSDDRSFWETIVRKGLKSIWSDDDLKPKKVAKLLGIKDRTVVNIRRGHRKISAADLFIIAKSLDVSPIWLIEEIIRRNKRAIERRGQDNQG